MSDPLLILANAKLFVTKLEGHERLGEPTHFVLDVTATEPLDVAMLVGSSGALLLLGTFDGRVIHGVVASLTERATRQEAAARTYRVELRSFVHVLTLRRRTRVFQKKSVPDIVKQVFDDAGVGGDLFRTALLAEHPAREYVTQYDETDLAFVRRLCEEDGLYYHFEPSEGHDTFVLDDTSSEAPKALDEPLALVDASAALPSWPALYHARRVRARRPGKVTLRDYDPKKPALDLEATASGGVDKEQQTEVYRAPFGYTDPGEGKRLASILLESLRAESNVVSFHSTFQGLRPGLRFAVELDPGYVGSARPEGEHVVVAVRHGWKKGDPQRTMEVHAIPKELPYRLPRVTPRPKISGIHSAFVTGAPGEEIHTDDGGHVKVRFHWDREQPMDDTSSLPVRVMQTNMPGPQLVPRVGWEVLVAFEDGNPDRPYVLGRVYDAKWPPPFALPANKTMTALGTVSSPGGKAPNIVHIDDGKGREHMVWTAGFDKTTTVANNALWQTVGFERLTVTGSQTRTVGANEKVSVKNTFLESVDSQTLSVGAMHDVLVKATATIKVGSEALAVGGALIEQVGNPVDGLKAFAESAVLAGVGQIPGVGEVLTKGYGAVKAVKEGYDKGGWKGAMTALGQQGVSFVADKVPGGDAIVAAADATGLPPWSDKAQKKAGEQEAGGGNAGSSGKGAAAAAAAPGHRKIIIDGAMSEAIGAASASTTPGSIKWTGVGAAAVAVGGSHSTKAVTVNHLTGGASSDTSATLSITAGKNIGRTLTGALSTTIGGNLTEKSGGAHHIKTKGKLNIEASGAVVLEGASVVFQVGSSVVAVHGGGVVMKSSKIEVKKASKQSGKGTKK